MKAYGFDKRFGKRIADTRIELGLSQKDLALRLGVTRSYVSMWETGEHIPSQIQLIALSTVLSCPVVKLDPNFEFDPAKGREFLKSTRNIKDIEVKNA